MPKAQQSRILSTIHETARELEAAGFISKRRMGDYDALCLPPVPVYTKAKVRKLRGNMSQTVFAAVLNTSPSTVRQWETGKKQPSGTSSKLLYLIETKGVGVLL
jgi:putative transcriptional regulator